MSTSINSQNEYLVTLSDEDRDTVISLMLDYAGVNENDLIKEARAEEFSSSRTRVAWFTIGSLIANRRRYE